MSVTVRERDREREWDSRSFHEDRPRGSVTIRRYKVPDRDEDEHVATASRYSRRENLTSPRQSEFRESSNVREFRYERDVETDRPRDRDLWEYRSERARSPPRDDYREIRIEREVSREPPRRERDNYELDHYTKTVDYYGREARDSPQPIIIRNDAPQPIIIREQAPQPIIIREERPRSPRSEMVREREREEERHTEVDRRTEVDRKTEVNEERSVAVVKREESPHPQDDEYYYQRTTREIARRDRDDYDDYKSQRDARHRDSASQHHRRNEEEDYYYRREEYDTGNDRARSKSRHRLHLAEGAIAGVGAAALLNRQRKREGERSGGVKNLVGGALVGTAATEIVSRARSHLRGGSRSRSRSESPDRDRGRRHRDRDRDHSRSRSRSKSKEGPFGIGHMSNLGKLGAVAAIGALAGYAASRRGKNKEEDRRSRSRVRQSSQTRSRDLSEENAHERKNRNATIAKAGLASAAVAGVVERVRSRSRGGRSKSRLRTGAPIAAAGLGGAALAGLYERHKSKRDDREVDERRSYSRSRSRSAMPAAAEGAYASRDMPPNDQNLIEYGEDPIGPADGHHRPGSRAGSHYSEYAARRRSSSGSASPRRRRYASRSRSRDRAAEAAAGAGIAGVAAHEASQRRERKRAERQRRREEEAGPQSSPGAAGYGFGPYAQEPPPVPVAPQQQHQQQQEYPQTHEQYYQPDGVYAPPNAYSPMPQFVGAGPPANGYDAHGFAAQQPPAPAQAGYGYQNQGHQYPPNNVSIPFVIPEEARTDVSEHTAERSIQPRAPSPAAEATAADEDAAGALYGQRRSLKSVAFDLRPNLDNPHHSPNVSPRSQPVDSDGLVEYDGAVPRSDARGCEREETDKSRGGQATGGEDEAGSHSPRSYDGDRFKKHASWLSNSGEEHGGVGHKRAMDCDRDRSSRREHENADNRKASQNAGGRNKQDEEDGGRRRRRGQGRRQGPTPPQPRPQQESDDSSETISLPDRFDSEGRKKPERGEDPLTDGMEDLLQGRGAAGRLFHRFAQGLTRPRQG